jgi:hypothetical protein
MLAMASGGFVRSWHDRLFVEPVRRVVAQELEHVSLRLETSLQAVHGDLRRILSDLADADDQVAEAIGRSLTRLSAETEALGDELQRLNADVGKPDPPR